MHQQQEPRGAVRLLLVATSIPIAPMKHLAIHDDASWLSLLLLLPPPMHRHLGKYINHHQVHTIVHWQRSWSNKWRVILILISPSSYQQPPWHLFCMHVQPWFTVLSPTTTLPSAKHGATRRRHKLHGACHNSLTRDVSQFTNSSKCRRRSTHIVHMGGQCLHRAKPIATSIIVRESVCVYRPRLLPNFFAKYE